MMQKQHKKQQSKVKPMATSKQADILLVKLHDVCLAKLILAHKAAATSGTKVVEKELT